MNMNIINLFNQLISREPSLRVSFYLTGGQVIVFSHVKEITMSKGADGNFVSYSIEWHKGFKPSLSTIALDHISAVTAVKE